MSQFEFVQITFAIILGLGVTTILNGIGEQLRRRDRHPLFALQIASSLLLLLVILAWLWGFWQTRLTNWNFGLFLAYATPSVCLALAANVSRIDSTSGSDTTAAQYFRNAPIYYGLWATAEAIGIVLGFLYAAGLDDYDGQGLLVFSLARGVGAALTLSLGIVKNTSYHWIVLGLLSLQLLVLIVAFITNLTAG